MRLFLLTIVTMMAFAGNSVLNRLALAAGDMDAGLFGGVRLVAGAVVLTGLVLVQRKSFTLYGARRWAATAALLVYIFGFSWAYLSLDAGLGALVLFGVVQMTMFAGALAENETVPKGRWIGAIVAFAGLAWLLWPSGNVAHVTLSAPHTGAMILAGVGWGVYSLIGRREADPLVATASNFLLAAGVFLVIGGAAMFVSGGLSDMSGAVGRAMPSEWIRLWPAVASGVVTSGIGYALWYHILPALGASRAAVAQLSVPVIALVGGAMWLGEIPDIKVILAGCIVLGGVGLSVLRTKPRSKPPE